MPERMSPVASIMWEMGQDPALRMTVGSLMVLSRAPAIDALTERFNRAADHAPMLRRHPESAPGIGSQAAWVDDDQADAATHVRAMAIASPGDLRQVLDLVALVDRSPFDPELSPWDATLIEGLADGRVALYLRAHHCLTDGVNGVSLVRLLLDEHATSTDEPDSVDTMPSGDDPQPTTEPDAGAKIIEASFGSSRRRPGTVSVTIDLAGAVHPIANGVATA